MYTSALDYTNSTYTNDTSTASNEMGQDAFLTLLLAQLENQDPLNPTDDTEMLSELATFSQLEQLTEMNETLAAVASSINTSNTNSSLAYIGTEVVAAGDTLKVSDGDASSVVYTLDEDATDVYANIYDSDGDIVRTIELGDKSSGSYTLNWDGRDYNGDVVDDGFYTISFGASDANGDSVIVDTEIGGTVVGLSSNSDGELMLELDDGRQVNMLYVSSVTAASTSSEDA